MPIAGTRYLRPGAYIGQIIRPNPGGLPDLARLPILVGKGSRLARGRNLPMLRSFVVDEALTFTPVPPYRADLTFNSNQDREDPDVQLVDDLGTEILKSKWFFVDADTIEVDPTLYSAVRTYTMDYQSSDRTPLDPLALNDIRGSVRVSLSTDQDEFDEFEHFFFPITMGATGEAAGILAPTITDGSATLEVPLANVLNAGGVVVTQDGASAYTHLYSRKYTIFCIATTPGIGVSLSEYRWSSEPLNGGNASLPHIPPDPTLLTRWPVFDHDQNVSGDAKAVTLEHGIVLLMTEGDANDPIVGDSWTFEVHAAPRMEIDRRHLASNQYLSYGSVTPVDNVVGPVANTGILVGEINLVTSAFAGSLTRDYEIECVASGGVAPNRTATMKVSSYSETSELTTQSFSLTETPASMTTTLSGGVVIDWSYPNVAVGQPPAYQGVDLGVGPLVSPIRGDRWTLTVSPARLFANVKDDRSYALQVTAVADALPGTTLSGVFLTDTIEGSFGSWTATASSYVNVTGSTTGLPDNVRLHARNVAVTSHLDNKYTVAPAFDQFDFDITIDDVIDWSLVERKTEVFSAADWRFDPLGSITGTVNTWYVLLERVPTSVITVNNGTTTVSYTRVADTGYLWVLAVNLPVVPVSVVYEWIAAEPSPGQTYYLSANYVRTADMFNTPILVRTEEEARTLLSPMDGANDLLIGAEAAFHFEPPGIYIVQVKDADEDTVYVDADYRTAIAASELTSLGTDLIVLNRWNVLGDALTSVDKMNNPAERKRRLLWAGAPVGTSVGDTETAGSLIFIAQNTLAVHGQSDAHGTRILHGSTLNVRTITLDSGQTQQVTLDGSFMSALLAGLVASFDAPWETVMRRTLGFFDSIEIHSEAEDLALGGSQIIYFSDLGAGTFRIEEDFTTDNFAEQFRYINTMTTQHYMSRFVEKDVDTAIGLVPPSRGEGADIVLGLVLAALRKALATGIIAEYQNADGTPRALDAGKDVIAFSDPGDSTRVQFRFTYYLRYILKTAIGLYSTDGAPFDT